MSTYKMRHMHTSPGPWCRHPHAQGGLAPTPCQPLPSSNRGEARVSHPHAGQDRTAPRLPPSQPHRARGHHLLDES